MKSLPISLALGAGLQIMAFTSGLAEDEPVPILDSIIVSGTRQEESVFDVPYSASVLPEEKISERAPRSLPEALKETPGILVQKTAHGHGSPFIRGLTSFRNVALIDGIRFNHAGFRDGPNQYWNTIDTYTARSVELVKGQGSVLFGSDAMGGVLNVQTKRPAYADSGFLAGGKIIGRYSRVSVLITASKPFPTPWPWRTHPDPHPTSRP